MSSYSEYLGRMKQRMVTITDTRPHRDAGHQTEIVRRLAASGNLETRVASTACALVLNAPSTRTAAGYLMEVDTQFKMHRCMQSLQQDKR